MTRLHSHCQQDSCGDHHADAEKVSCAPRHATRTVTESTQSLPQENPLSPRAIAERFDIEAEVKAILHQTVVAYREFHPEEGQKQLSEILAEQGLTRFAEEK